MGILDTAKSVFKMLVRVIVYVYYSAKEIETIVSDRE